MCTSLSYTGTASRIVVTIASHHFEGVSGGRRTLVVEMARDDALLVS